MEESQNLMNKIYKYQYGASTRISSYHGLRKTASSRPSISSHRKGGRDPCRKTTDLQSRRTRMWIHIAGNHAGVADLAVRQNFSPESARYQIALALANRPAGPVKSVGPGQEEPALLQEQDHRPCAAMLDARLPSPHRKCRSARSRR